MLLMLELPQTHLYALAKRNPITKNQTLINDQQEEKVVIPRQILQGKMKTKAAASLSPAKPCLDQLTLHKSQAQEASFCFHNTVGKSQVLTFTVSIESKYK